MMQNISVHSFILVICAVLVRCEDGIDCYEAEKCDQFDIKHGRICCPSIDIENGVIVCDKENFKGRCKFYSMYGKRCLNLDENDTASSVNTLRKCFRIFEHINCKGQSTPVLPGSPSHNNMTVLHMNNIITSIGHCDRDDYVVEFIRVKRLNDE